MEHMPRRPKKPAESRHKMGLRAVGRLQDEVKRIYDDIDTQSWNASEKLAHYQQVFGVFGSWFLGALPSEKRVEILIRMASLAGAVTIGSAPRIFH